MLKKLLKSKLTWIFLTITGLLALLITFSYLGAFLDPTDNTHNMPLAIVNSDAGLTVQDQQVNYGQKVVEQLTQGQNTDTYKWEVLSSRESALAALNQDKFYAAIIIPSDYSAKLATLSTLSATSPIQIEILTNPAAGTLGGSQAQGVATAVVTGLSKTTSDQILQGLASAGAKLNPQMVAVLGNPIQAKITVGVPVGNHSARGMTAFYFPMMLILSSFLGTNVMGTLIDLFSEERYKKGLKVSPLNVFYTKALLYTLMGVLTALLVTFMAVVVLGMDTPDWVSLTLFAVLGSLAVAEVALFFQMAFGRLGLLVGVIFFTILGVPASGGPYPSEMLPSLWQFLHNWLPMRYMTDGVRSILFMGGNGDAGLTAAIIALSLYVISGVLLAWLFSYFIGMRNRWEAADGVVDQVIEHAVEASTGA